MNRIFAISFAAFASSRIPKTPTKKRHVIITRDEELCFHQNIKYFCLPDLSIETYINGHRNQSAPQWLARQYSSNQFIC